MLKISYYRLGKLPDVFTVTIPLDRGKDTLNGKPITRDDQGSFETESIQENQPTLHHSIMGGVEPVGTQQVVVEGELASSEVGPQALFPTLNS